MSQIQCIIYFHVHILFPQSHTFNSVTNLVVLSTFTFISHSTVPHIQPCNKFNCLTSFYNLIYFKSVQIHWSYLIPQSNFIQQSHTFNSVTNSVLLSTFTFISDSTVSTYSTMKQIQQSYLFYIISYSTVPCIQKCNKVNGLFLVYILISFNSRTYSKVSQIKLYYLLSRSYLIQQSQHIQQWNKYNSLIWFNSIISFNSPTYSTM